MLERMNVMSHVPMILAKQGCMDLHSDNWANAANYMVTKIAEFFPHKKQDTKHKGCFIYKAHMHGRGGRERPAGRGL